MKIAVIPARGGSKRIPRKNIKLFDGKPIIAYSIEAAKRSALFDRIIVSTDDNEIAAVAKEYGAEVPFVRPTELADDFTGTNAVAKHAIEWFRENGEVVQYACCIYATAPFLDAKYLREGFDRLSVSDKAFAFSVTGFDFPIQRAIRIDDTGALHPFYPEFVFTRSQDLVDAYHDAGQFYWGRAEAFLTEQIVFSDQSLPVILPSYLVQDIDNPDDWQRAELMFSAWKMRKELNP